MRRVGGCIALIILGTVLATVGWQSAYEYIRRMVTPERRVDDDPTNVGGWSAPYVTTMDRAQWRAALDLGDAWDKRR